MFSIGLFPKDNTLHPAPSVRIRRDSQNDRNYKTYNNMKKYQITGYQIVHHDGTRDTVKLAMPEIVNDIENYRRRLINREKCKYINLSYVELNDWEEQV